MTRHSVSRSLLAALVRDDSRECARRDDGGATVRSGWHGGAARHHHSACVYQCYRREARRRSRSGMAAPRSTAAEGSGTTLLLSCNTAPSDRTRDWYASGVALDTVLK